MSLPTLVDSLAARAAQRPKAIALSDDADQIDYLTLWRHGRQVCMALAALGIGRGDRVLHLGADSVRFYELLYGAALRGAVVVPVSPRLADDEIRHILAHSECRLVVTDRTEVVPADLPLVPLSEFDQWRESTKTDANPDDSVATISQDTPVVQLYTSGTTGMPKGVVLAHRTFAAVRTLLSEARLDWLTWTETDVSLSALSASHIGGLWWTTQGLASGAHTVLMPAFSAGTARELIRDRRVSTTCMVPSMLMMVLEEGSPEDFESLRSVVYGGSPIAPDLLRRAMAVMNCEFAQIYGLTETGNTAVCLTPDDHRRDETTLKASGRPYPGVRVEVRGPNGVPVPNGQTGEVFLWSPARMVGYFRNSVATAETMDDGWVATGDAGHLTDDGLVYIADRMKDMIIVGGENVFPAEVEKAIAEHPSVKDCAVIGVPDDRWGESVHAFVVARESQTFAPGAVARSLRGMLAPFKMPVTYQQIDEIPRNASGKPLRRQLREPFWAGRERAVN